MVNCAHLVEPAKLNAVQLQSLGVADIARDLDALAYFYVALRFQKLF